MASGVGAGRCVRRAKAAGGAPGALPLQATSPELTAALDPCQWAMAGSSCAGRGVAKAHDLAAAGAPRTFLFWRRAGRRRSSLGDARRCAPAPVRGGALLRSKAQTPCTPWQQPQRPLQQRQPHGAARGARRKRPRCWCAAAAAPRARSRGRRVHPALENGRAGSHARGLRLHGRRLPLSRLGLHVWARSRLLRRAPRPPAAPERALRHGRRRGRQQRHCQRRRRRRGRRRVQRLRHRQQQHSGAASLRPWP